MVILLRGSLLQATGAVVISIVCVLFLRSRAERRPERTGPPDVDLLQLPGDRLHGEVLAHVRAPR